MCDHSHLVRNAVEHVLALKLVAEKAAHPCRQVSRCEQIVPVLIDGKPCFHLRWAVVHEVMHNHVVQVTSRRKRKVFSTYGPRSSRQDY